MQVTENNSMAFMDWKVASVPVQRCNQLNRAASNGEWYGDREQTQKDQTQEVTLDPRTLQNQWKRAQAASKLGHVKTPQHQTTAPTWRHSFCITMPPSIKLTSPDTFLEPKSRFFRNLWSYSILTDHLLLVAWFKFLFDLPYTVNS